MNNTDTQKVIDRGARILRTVVQVGIPAFLSFAVVLPIVIQALGLPVDGALYGYLIAFAGAVTAVAAALSRIMAIPAINGWLGKIGLGATTVPATLDDPTTLTEQDITE